jgi:hypothetical protein
MSVRSDLNRLKKDIGTPEECPGVIVQIRYAGLDLALGDQDPDPPLCPRCLRRHWAAAQHVLSVEAVRPGPDQGQPEQPSN